MYVFQQPNGRLNKPHYHRITPDGPLHKGASPLYIYKMGNRRKAESSMTARVTEQRSLRELSPAGSLACPPSVTRKRTSKSHESVGAVFVG